MSRRNLGKTNLNTLMGQRRRYLHESNNRLIQLRSNLDLLEEAGVEHDLVSKLYDRELARNKRLTKALGEF